MSNDDLLGPRRPDRNRPLSALPDTPERPGQEFTMPAPSVSFELLSDPNRAPALAIVLTQHHRHCKRIVIRGAAALQRLTELAADAARLSADHEAGSR